MSDDHAPAPRPLLSQFADDPELRELVQLFASELPDRIRAIEDAWSRREVNSLRRTVHQLRGASAGYGFPTIGRAAGEIEDGLRALGRSDDPGWGTLRRQVDHLIDLCRSASADSPR